MGYFAARAVAATTVLGALVVLLRPATAEAGGGAVPILVLREHGVGTATQAQPLLDKLVGITAKLNNWSSASGQYHTTRSGAEAFIAGSKPHYGIFSLGAFLGLRKTHGLEVVGQVRVSRAGGQQYFLISKTAGDLAGCKGRTLASDHVDDARFIEKVVAKGAFKLGDFTVVPTKRPLQTIRKITGGDAVCALIDDAQHTELPHLDDAAGVKAVWASDKLPPMVVAAFPVAGVDERATFRNNLPRVCQGDGKTVCGEVGLQALTVSGPGDYAAIVDAYDK